MNNDEIINTADDSNELKDAWLYFGLSYASWLVLPRVALQSMPDDWQHKFFLLVEELEDTLEFPEEYTSEFVVTMKRNGKLAKNVLPHYRHNRLPLKENSTDRGDK